MGTSMETKPGIRTVGPKLLLLPLAEDSFSQPTRVAAICRRYKPTMSARAGIE
jgi:hypothetical protein